MTKFIWEKNNIDNITYTIGFTINIYCDDSYSIFDEGWVIINYTHKWVTISIQHGLLHRHFYSKTVIPFVPKCFVLAFANSYYLLRTLHPKLLFVLVFYIHNFFIYLEIYNSLVYSKIYVYRKTKTTKAPSNDLA